ncbi:hypothetical protein P9112_003015 [Eukaryota sp. TZLM1-RC]
MWKFWLSILAGILLVNGAVITIFFVFIPNIFPFWFFILLTSISIWGIFFVLSWRGVSATKRYIFVNSIILIYGTLILLWIWIFTTLQLYSPAYPWFLWFPIIFGTFLLFWFSRGRLKKKKQTRRPVATKNAAARSINYSRVVATPRFQTKDVLPETTKVKEPSVVKRMTMKKAVPAPKIPTQFLEKMTPLPKSSKKPSLQASPMIRKTESPSTLPPLPAKKKEFVDKEALEPV